MSYVSPRSLQLLHDIISDGEETSANLYTEQTDSYEVDKSLREENMNGDVDTNFNDALNLFEKLKKENGSVGVNGQVQVNGFMNGHVENGLQEDTLQGISEKSDDESYTVTEEVSETTADTSALDTSNSTRISKKISHTRRSKNHRRDQNHNFPKPSKTSSVRDNSTDRDSMSDLKETMSDSGRVGRRQRKLKRAQYREFRPIGLEPLETAEERLEQKYKELEDLMSGQFVEQKQALTMNHLQQMELLRQQYAIASHGLPPSGVLIPRSLPSHHRSNGYHRQAGRDKENHGHPASEDEAYTTIRTLQASRVSQRRSRARSARTRPLSATRHNQSRSTSRDGRDRGKKNEEQGERSKARSRSTSGSRSSSRSPRRPATETRLKNTDNEFVRDWIKKKDREYRQQKADERRRKRQQRKEKIEKQLEREEKYKDSHQVVEAWMKQKQRDAYRKQRQERRALRQEVKEKEQERSQSVSGIHGWGVDRPLSAPSPIRNDRNKIRVQRPGTTASEVREAKQSDNDNTDVHHEIPQPPMTKYVYRRPVLGKVRLRNKTPQQEERKPAPVKKSVEKPLSKEEIERKQRVSYDDWLQQKRKENQEKKKEMQRKKELAQSNPEYEVPVPELVQNSENNVLRGKRIPGSSGRSSARVEYVSKIISPEERERIREMARGKKRLNRSVEEEVDTSYDEGSESAEEAIQRVAKNVVNFVLKSLSDEEAEDDLFEDTDEVEHEGLSNFSILGSRKTLSSRPMSASAARIPGPQVSRSPRRPVSAQPKQKEASRTSFEGCIPFPDDIGAPPHVLRVQGKLFGERMSDNSEDERQVTSSNESSSKVGRFTVAEEEILQEADNKFETQEEEVLGEDQTREEDGIQESQKKHVSFCEETTIFDDVDPAEYEELKAWSDGAPETDLDVEKIRKMFAEGCQDQTQTPGQEEQNQEQSNIEREQNHEQGGIEEETQQQGDKEEETQEQGDKEEETQGDIERNTEEQGDTDGQTQENGDVEEQTQQDEVEEQNQEQANLEEQTQEDNSGNDQEGNKEDEEIAEDLPEDETIDEEQEKQDQQQDGDSVFLTSSPEF